MKERRGENINTPAQHTPHIDAVYAGTTDMTERRGRRIRMCRRIRITEPGNIGIDMDMGR